MLKNGRKINQTARYTEKQMRQILNDTINRRITRFVNELYAVCLMAYKDTEEKNIKEFQENIHKYLNDLCSNEFTMLDVKKYNKDALKDFEDYIKRGMNIK